MAKKCCPVKIINLGGTGNGTGPDDYSIAGNFITDGIVVNRFLGGSFNLTGMTQNLDFNNLTPQQVDDLESVVQTQWDLSQW